MAVDTFICGTCQVNFYDISEFVAHKNAGCVGTAEVTTPDGTTTTVQIVDEGGKLIQIITKDELCSDSEQVQEVQMVQQDQAQEQQQSEIHLVPVPESDLSGEQAGYVVGSDVQIVIGQHLQETDQDQTAINTAPDGATPGRRGRPKRGEPRKKARKQEQATPVKLEPLEPIEEGGWLHCPRCKRRFTRERHYRSHACMVGTDYVDLTKKDALGSDVEDDSEEEWEQEEEEEKKPKDKPIKPRVEGKVASRRGRPKGWKKKKLEDPVEIKPIGILAKVIPKSEGLVQNVEGVELQMPGEEPGKDTKLEGVVLQQEGLVSQEGVVLHPVGVEPIQEGAVLVPGGVVPQPEGVVAVQEGVVLVQEGAVPQPEGVVPIQEGVELQPQVTEAQPQNLPTDPDLQSTQVKPPTIILDSTFPATEDTNKAQIVLTKEQLAEVTSAAKQNIPDIPIWNKEEDRTAFEEAMNIDISFVDPMFKTHVIEQDVNEKGYLTGNRAMSTQLTVFSCSSCSKVFKSLSHMRHHCLIHTDVKPYKCIKCSYATNSKGNMYTHMRKHTGQCYKCRHCSFQTSNKSHVLEHEATHSSERVTCDICKKTYNTIKSLINHVRKYHAHNKAGRDYLASFQTRASKAAAILHQCHVCNRKFKKKVDRDRHLLVHNIQGNTMIHQCELCSYTTSRLVYLEKHFSKHRVVYNCIECSMKFPSSVRLNSHLASTHDILDANPDWYTVFQKCINSSLYLPEPDGSTDFLGQDGDGDEDVSDGIDAADVPEPRPDTSVITSTSIVATKSGKDETTAATDHLMQAQGAEQAKGEPSESGQGKDEAEQFNDPDLSDIMNMDIPPQDYNIYERLKYQAMTMDIFQRLRHAFGNEECEWCGRLFSSKAAYAPHLRTHTGLKPFGCDQCDYKAITKDNLKRHIEKEHDKVTYVCNQCDFVANSRTQLWHHQQKHKEPLTLKCPKCNLTLPTAKRLKIHMLMKHPAVSQAEIKKATGGPIKAHPKLGKRSFKCPYCDKLFSRAGSDLQKHIWIHEGIKPYKCPKCPHACRSKNNLAAHMLRHSSEKPFLCNECGKAYKSKTALRWHVRTHKDGKIFKCTKCDYEASQKSHLIRHLETHNIVKRFICQHCDYSANTLGYMKIHYTRNHRGHQFQYNQTIHKAMPADTKVYRCLSCDYLFGNLSDMKRHLKIKHHLQVEDIHVLENLDPTEESVTEPLTVDLAGEQVQAGMEEQANLQVVQLAAENVLRIQGAATADEQDATAALQTLQYAGGEVSDGSVEERTVSAVNLLQHIIDMQHQQQNESGEAEGGEAIIVQPNGEEEVVVASGEQDVMGTGEQPQYVIQYVTQDGTPISEASVVSAADVMQVSAGLTDGTHDLSTQIISGLSEEQVQQGGMMIVSEAEAVTDSGEQVQQGGMMIVSEAEAVADTSEQGGMMIVSEADAGTDPTEVIGTEVVDTEVGDEAQEAQLMSVADDQTQIICIGSAIEQLADTDPQQQIITTSQ